MNAHHFAVALVFATCSPAQSEGEIRPVSKLVFAAFPEAETVRHIVRDVDEAARHRIETTLPFQIHFEELGEHRLHVAFRGRKPVGMMFVRSEQTNWGLADIGWAMTLDGRIVGFAFTNDRSREARELPRSPFARQLAGLDFRGVKQLAARRSAAPDARPPARPAGEPAAAALSPTHRMVLRSAMKATLVTELVWHDQIHALADLAMLLDELPGSRPGRRADLEVPPPPPSTADGVADGEGRTARRIVSGRAIEAHGQRGTIVGRVARTTARVDVGKPRTVELIWTIDPTGRVLSVRPARSWADDELRRACMGLRGGSLAAPLTPDSPLAPVARELAPLLLAALPPRLGR